MSNESSNYPELSKEEALVRQCFNHLNAYKRFRAMGDNEHDKDKAQYYELQMYKTIDQLELALRGVQSAVRTQR